MSLKVAKEKNVPVSVLLLEEKHILELMVKGKTDPTWVVSLKGKTDPTSVVYLGLYQYHYNFCSFILSFL